MGVEVSRLSNGLTVATETLPSIETVALGVWVKSGARNERDDEHGMAHLLEHMAFKGTGTTQRLRRSPRKSRMSAARSTPPPASRRPPSTPACSRTTCRSPSIFSPTSSPNSTFDPDELEREQHVILQEIGAAHDTPDDVVFDNFTETAFRHQTIGRSILGTPETVQILHLRSSSTPSSSANTAPSAWSSLPPARQPRRIRARSRDALGSFRPRPKARCRNMRTMSAATSARTAT